MKIGNRNTLEVKGTNNALYIQLRYMINWIRS